MSVLDMCTVLKKHEHGKCCNAYRIGCQQGSAGQLIAGDPWVDWPVRPSQTSQRPAAKLAYA
jgi:hypothetical protein